MKKILMALVVLVAAGAGWATNYYVRNDGSSATGTGTGAATAFGVANASSKTFSAGDTLFVLDSGGPLRATLTLLGSGNITSRIVMTPYSGNNPVFTASNSFSNGATYTWHLSAHGTNEFYVTTAANGNPSIASAPTYAFDDDTMYIAGTLGALTNHTRAYGDNDGLGYNTVYIRDDRGSPNTTSAAIEFSARANVISTTTANFWLIQNLTLEHSTTTHLNLQNARGMIIDNCKIRWGYGAIYLYTQSIQYNRMWIEGMQNRGVYIAGAGPDTVTFSYSVFKDNTLPWTHQVVNTGKSIYKIYNCTFYGSVGNTISILANDSGNYTIKNSIFSANRGSIVNGSTKAKISVDYCNYAYGYAPAGSSFLSWTIDTNGANNFSGNVGYRKARYTSSVILSNDDQSSFATQYQFLDTAIKYGTKLSIGYNSGFYNPASHDSLLNYINSGMEIMSHGSYHENIGLKQSMWLRYTGAGAACTLSIDTATGILSTRGAGADNVSYDLKVKPYRNVGNLVDSLLQHNYTAGRYYTASTQSYYFPMWDTVNNCSTYKPKTNVLIKGATSDTVYWDSVKYIRESAQNDRLFYENTFPGYSCTSWMWPAGNGQDSLYTYPLLKSFGFSSARANTVPAEMDMNAYKAYRIAARSKYIIDTTDSNSIKRCVAALADFAGWNGVPMCLYDHAPDPALGNIIKYVGLASDNRVSQRWTFKDLHQYISTHGTTSDSLTWRVKLVDSTDLRLHESSPVIRYCDTSVFSGIANVKDMSGTRVTDSVGHVLFNTLSMGAYQYYLPLPGEDLVVSSGNFIIPAGDSVVAADVVFNNTGDTVTIAADLHVRDNFSCAAGVVFVYSNGAKIIMPSCTIGTTNGNTSVVLTYPAGCGATRRRGGGGLRLNGGLDLGL